ncbi:MAG: alkaline shock response membrane anchor protein AmaP [Candidatus Omnitrophica bacterium]|nr:alkaline shock response membrane anchor protein AmaP [Candidatus Omnitrophota bacterium]
MKFIKSLAIGVHALVFLVMGGILILLSIDLFASDDVMKVVNFIYNEPNVKLALGVLGGIFIFGGLVTAHIGLGKLQMEKTIAFENPEGQVTVSLSAIEDFIKKSVRHIAEVKELRSNVTASKRGINILCKATIFDDSNIPEITEKLQGIVKAKVRDMLGVEETINTKIHVTKISSRGKGEAAQAPAKEYEETSRRMPFGGVE